MDSLKALLEWPRNATIRWLKAGYGDADGVFVRGGPIRISGYYVNPYFDQGCCRPSGPFRSERAARRWLLRRDWPLRNYVDRRQRKRGPSDWETPRAYKSYGRYIRKPKLRKRGASEPYYIGQWLWRR